MIQRAAHLSGVEGASAEWNEIVAECGQPEVSVIIVNWNTQDLLRDCIRSIYDQTHLKTQIIVVDNCSSDGSAEMVEVDFPEVNLIANTTNRGFAAANNQGLKVAMGAHVLLLNPDTIILDGAIDKMVAWLLERREIGCAGCQVWESPETIQKTCFADPGPLNLAIVAFGLMRLASWIPRFGQPWYLGWDRRSERDVDVVSGMFMLVPRHVLDAVGLLDEAFFVYAEEADWCRRIRNAGWRCTFTPEARILHLDGGSKSTAQIKSRMHVQMQKSHLIYARKHDGLLGHIFLKMVFMLSAFLRFAIFGFLRLFRKDETMRARVRLSIASLRFLSLGKEPTK